jgi:hypothetical protein
VFNTHKDRGRVLLAVRVHSRGWTLFLWVVLVCVVALALALALLLKPHRWKNSLQGVWLVLFYLSLTGDYLFYPRIKFQEGGVQIPVNRDCRRVRFMRWNQIRRWSWDGDFLILTGANFKGGAVRIPGTERLAVDHLMGTKLAVLYEVPVPRVPGRCATVHFD